MLVSTAWLYLPRTDSECARPAIWRCCSQSHLCSTKRSCVKPCCRRKQVEVQPFASAFGQCYHPSRPSVCLKLLESKIHMRSPPTWTRMRRKLTPTTCEIIFFTHGGAQISITAKLQASSEPHASTTSLVLTSIIVTCAISLNHLSFAFAWRRTLADRYNVRADRKPRSPRCTCKLVLSGRFRAGRRCGSW